jgi:hypothetical protein
VRKLIMVTALAVWSIFGASMSVAQDQRAKQDATVDFTGSAIAIGMGYTWGSGTLHYQGKDFPFTASGMTLADIGGTTNVVSAEVYRLSKVEDFPGTYSIAQAGATLVGGGGIGYLENEKGVVLKVTSSTKGARLNLGVGGVEIAMKR